MKLEFAMHGYGFDTFKIKTTKERLLKLIELAPSFKYTIEEFLDYAYNTNLEEAELEEILDWYSPDYEFESGIGSILYDIIYEVERIRLTLEDDYLFYPATLPWNSYVVTEKEYSETDIFNIFNKYISILTDEEITFELCYFGLE